MADQLLNGADHGPELRTAEQELRALSIFAERIQWMRQAGIGFNGDRDYYQVLGYDRIITIKQYRDEYARGGIAKRIIECFPKATWRGGVELFEDEDPEATTEFEKAWLELNDRLNVWTTLLKADILAGLSTYSTILLGAPGELDTPLPKGKKLLYLQPFFSGGGPGAVRNNQTAAMQADCSILEFDVDPKSPRFGEPLSYQIKRTDLVSPALARPVHWTRIVHIAEGCLDDNVYGAPTLENIWNLLCDLLKVTGGGAEAFWLRANAGLQIDIDKDMALSTDPAQAAAELERLKQQTEDYKHGITRLMRTRGVNINQLGSDVANFDNPAQAILTQIAGSKGIPMRILTGSERGELASTQDAANFNTQVQDRRTSYAGPMIVRRLVDRLIEFGYLPTPKQYDVSWPTIETMSDMEKAEGAKRWAETITADGKAVYTTSEIREHWQNLQPLTPEQIAEMAPPAPEPAPEAPPEAPVVEEPKEEEPKALEEHPDAELIRVLAAAIENGATEVVDAIIGTQRDLGGPGSGWTAENGHVPGAQGGSGADAFFEDLDAAGFRNPMNDRENILGSEAGVEISKTSDGLRLHSVRSFATKSGAGTRAMQTVMDLADKHGLKIEGTAKAFKTSQKDTLSSVQLKKWYTKLGFTVKVNGDMVRMPKSSRTLGGPGSGNFGHSGRPGQIGGSGDGGSYPKANNSPSMLEKVGGIDSLTQHTRPDGTLTPERKALHERIITEQLANHAAQTTPSSTMTGGGSSSGKTNFATTYLTGGGGASGKSVMQAELAIPQDRVHVDVDVIRTKLPEWDTELARAAASGEKTHEMLGSYTHEEASMISKQIIDRTVAGHMNMLVDGAGDSGIEKLSANVARYKADGREIEAHYVTVDYETAYARMRERGDKTGRYIPAAHLKAVHADVSRTFPQAVERGLFDKFTLWDTNGSKPLGGGRFSKPLKVASGRGKEIVIHDQAAYDRFLAKGRQ